MVEGKIIAPQNPMDRLAQLEADIHRRRISVAEGLEALNTAAGAVFEQRGGRGLFSSPYIDTAGMGAALRREAEVLWGIEDERKRLRRELGFEEKEEP